MHNLDQQKCRGWRLRTVTHGGLVTRLLRWFILLTPPPLLTVVLPWNRSGDGEDWSHDGWQWSVAESGGGERVRGATGQGEVVKKSMDAAVSSIDMAGQGNCQGASWWMSIKGGTRMKKFPFLFNENDEEMLNPIPNLGLPCFNLVEAQVKC
ncbi:hypothetical protein PIB30_021085 [Stylosanthes scabra]|uniref:Uncharacterized protein n=1 Tax=Stylosanthes scabra TaxID=79078 RepID=A0ABU6Y944_9FABA|nr:hypothetical protein [Stylosanthes scabra]